MDPSVYRNTDAWPFKITPNMPLYKSYIFNFDQTLGSKLMHAQYSSAASFTIVWTSVQQFWVRMQQFWARMQQFWVRIQQFWVRMQQFWVRMQQFWIRMQQFWVPKPDSKPHPSLLTLFQFEILPFPDLISVSRFFPYRTYKRTFLRSKTVRYTVVFTHFDFIRKSNGDEKVE